jgi:hypothetical protein
MTLLSCVTSTRDRARDRIYNPTIAPRPTSYVEWQEFVLEEAKALIADELDPDFWRAAHSRIPVHLQIARI